MAKHLLHGRIRLSTVLIALLFIATLTTYLLVRPIPASTAGTNPPASPSPTRQPPPTPAATSPAPTTTTPHPTHTPTATPSPTTDRNPTSTP
jgi:hypothetical protein